MHLVTLSDIWCGSCPGTNECVVALRCGEMWPSPFIPFLLHLRHREKERKRKRRGRWTQAEQFIDMVNTAMPPSHLTQHHPVIIVKAT